MNHSQEKSVSEANAQAREAQEQIDKLTPDQFLYCLYMERLRIMMKLPIYMPKGMTGGPGIVAKRGR